MYLFIFSFFVSALISNLRPTDGLMFCLLPSCRGRCTALFYSLKLDEVCRVGVFTAWIKLISKISLKTEFSLSHSDQ